MHEWCNSSDATTAGNKNKLKQFNPYSNLAHVCRLYALAEIRGLVNSPSGQVTGIICPVPNMVTGQLADMPTRGLDKSRTGQLAVSQMPLAIVLDVLIAWLDYVNILYN